MNHPARGPQARVGALCKALLLFYDIRCVDQRKLPSNNWTNQKLRSPFSLAWGFTPTTCRSGCMVCRIPVWVAFSVLPAVVRSPTILFPLRLFGSSRRFWGQLKGREHVYVKSPVCARPERLCALPAVVIAPQSTSSAPCSLLSWHDRNFCLSLSIRWIAATLVQQADRRDDKALGVSAVCSTLLTCHTPLKNLSVL